MPILPREADIYPDDLLDRSEVGREAGRGWWAFYLRSRREKQFMRGLQAMSIPFYGPMVRKLTRSPSGRGRESFAPLFSSYVFVYGDVDARTRALTTECVSRWLPVENGWELTKDLRQIRRLIAADVPISIESQLEAGDLVRVKTGPFRGLEGVIVSRQGKTRLFVAVRFLQQGASMALEDFDVERV
jgi:transcriptional antiterminator RfaH